MPETIPFAKVYVTTLDHTTTRTHKSHDIEFCKLIHVGLLSLWNSFKPRLKTLKESIKSALHIYICMLNFHCFTHA